MLTTSYAQQGLDLASKTAIITGSNTGIGLETAKELARLGATVILACRETEKGLAALEVVKEYAKHERVSFIQLNLSDLESVRKFVSELVKNKISIDLLVNNAGTLSEGRRSLDEGRTDRFLPCGRRYDSSRVEDCAGIRTSVWGQSRGAFSSYQSHP